MNKILIVSMLIFVSFGVVLFADNCCPPFQCTLEENGTGTSYDGETDTISSTWMLQCVTGTIQDPCTGICIITVWQEICGNYSPVGQSCQQFQFDCGDNYPVWTVNLAKFKATYGAGNFKITWVFRSGTCDYPTGTSVTQTQYLTIPGM